ncbi:glycosyltransferase family 4 protein [Actinopolymorpha cephalotaxi]|uniref:glycosyltransferase family 4 protein n=1 Tax=Actinopolymorpha cephalotaxi TaxID=504797 RepID=UPI0015878089|nr:glycosyltransferase family 4 protein [Actinopolymorpha cephalotaxi]
MRAERTRRSDRRSEPLVTTPVVVVAPNLIPHYRVPVFRELAANPLCRYHFWAGDGEPSASIKVAEADQIPNRAALRNYYLGPLLWQAGLLRMVARVRPDAVIFTGDMHILSVWLGAALCRVLRIRVLFWTHGWRRDEHGVRRLARLSFYRCAHRLLLYGTRAKAIGARTGYPEDRMTVIYNSIEGPDPSPARTAERPMPGAGQTSRTTIRLIMCSRLIPIRRADLLFEAMRLLGDRGVTTSLRLLGDGPDRPRLERLAEDLRVDVLFVGAAYDREVITAHHRQSDICVVPAWGGLAVIQGLLARVPVVIHSNPADHGPEAEEVVPGLTGELFSQGDPRDLAAAIERCAGWCEVDAPARAKAFDDIAERYSPSHQARLIDEACRTEIRHRP